MNGMNEQNEKDRIETQHIVERYYLRSYDNTRVKILAEIVARLLTRVEELEKEKIDGTN